jgi:hypothetical protein
MHSYSKWSRESRLRNILSELTEGTVIIKRTPRGFLAIIKYMGKETAFQMNKYVTLERARKLFIEAQRQLTSEHASP